ncbi:TPA: TIR domain-containing protein [Vibrio alginolyticus]|uniref:TIR domain-containing protein n=1 Tax=Vibrio alginolyticus TaxID=663 RepID=UPI003D7E53F4
MKPNIFIGSSVEGLEIAYAIQENLHYDAECKVWSQGVFELSKTTMESLEERLKASDFAIFVFSDDDVIKMRGKERTSIRDNVLFEFGLFIGELGRERVFFVSPEGADIHIPTDILGVTGGTYETNRKDSCFKSAAGVFCNEVRRTAKKLGPLREHEQPQETNKEPEGSASTTNDTNQWFAAYLDSDFETAYEKLNKLIESETDDLLKFKQEKWKFYLEYKLGRQPNLDKLKEEISNSPDDIELILITARLFKEENDYRQCLELLDNYIANVEETVGNENIEKAILRRAELIEESLGEYEAIQSIESIDDYENAPELCCKLAELYSKEEGKEVAYEKLRLAHIRFPSNIKILENLAHKAYQLEEDDIAIYLYDLLTKKNPKMNNHNYGSISNSCLRLDLYNQAMEFCKKAQLYTDDGIDWLLMNEGNMLINRGFYSRGIKLLKEGLEITSASSLKEYAYERLAKSSKSVTTSEETYRDILKQGRLKLSKPLLEEE